MINFIYLLLSGAFSLVLIWLLRASDEKLARTRKSVRLKLSASARALLGASVFLPGVVLISISQISVLFSWFGTLTVLGWLIARNGQNSRSVT